MRKTIRAFIAFKLPEPVVDTLEQLQAALKIAGLNLRWVRAGNIHLTLKFLGNISSEDLRRVEIALRDVSGKHAAFSLMAKGLGLFPGAKKPRVIWTGIHGDVVRLKRLHGALEGAMKEIGFEPERRPFRGHLTIGRIKGRAERKKIAAAIGECGAYASPPFAANRLILFKSELKPGGAEYAELAGADLTGQPAV